jgi:hypothetical protein
VKRLDAVRQLGQLLGLELVGSLLDVIGDNDLRDLLLKAQIRTRAIETDSDLEAALSRRAR